MVNKDYRLWHHVWQGCGLGFISAADLCVSTRTDGRIYREKAIFRPHGRKKITVTVHFIKLIYDNHAIGHLC